MEKRGVFEKSGARQSLIRNFLGVLLAFAALNAFGGGYYALSGAEGVPREWLDGSPFRSYFVPGLVLFFGVGGCFLWAAIAVFIRSRKARLLAIFSVAFVLVWLAVQVAIIGYVSWMQPVTASVALLILFLSLTLRKNMEKEA